jgi:hypothetical protein
MKRVLLTILAIALAAPVFAKEELVTLPGRDSVQLTIYNSEDLTLVRERRTLSFKQGENRLQFSWANTLIDPTSVDFQPDGEKAEAALEVLDTSYPGESHEMLIWTVDCETAGSYGVEISYFTSGISWSAEYVGIVSDDERSMDLSAYVTVHNRSGEEYEDAQVRLVVGTINLVEKIINLAQPPMQQQQQPRPPAMAPGNLRRMADEPNADAEENGMARPKEIQKEGLSEYYIYTVEGTETIPNQWSKRLKSFTVKDVPLETVYRLEPKKFGPLFTKVLEFKNDEEHKLGKEPLPDGLVRLYKDMGEGRLAWMAQVPTKYIPKNEEVKINVGPDPECTYKRTRLSLKKKDLTFRNRRVVGWMTVEQYEIEVKNFRDRDVEIEIHQSMNGEFTFDSPDPFEKEDAHTQKIRFTLKKGETRKIRYTLNTKHGDNIK